jgi:hypothetical protein
VAVCDFWLGCVFVCFCVCMGGRGVWLQFCVSLFGRGCCSLLPNLSCFACAVVQSQNMAYEGRVGGGFQLNVTNLSYEPPTNLVKTLDDAHHWIQNGLPENLRRYVPHLVSESSLHAELISISFRAKAGDVTGVLSTKLPERKSLSDLLINRCQFGSFDGDIVMENAPYNTSFDENMAFVHRVSIHASTPVFLL